MEQVWFSAALWLVLALIATLLSIWFRISTALSEIVVGTVAQLIIGALIGTEVLGAKSAWVSFLAGTGAIVLTFLAGAELDPGICRTKWTAGAAAATRSNGQACSQPEILSVGVIFPKGRLRRTPTPEFIIG